MSKKVYSVFFVVEILDCGFAAPGLIFPANAVGLLFSKKGGSDGDIQR